MLCKDLWDFPLVMIPGICLCQYYINSFQAGGQGLLVFQACLLTCIYADFQSV